MVVYVDDINDNFLEFIFFDFFVSIIENVFKNSVYLIDLVFDRDVVENGIVDYLIIFGNDVGNF